MISLSLVYCWADCFHIWLSLWWVVLYEKLNFCYLNVSGSSSSLDMALLSSQLLRVNYHWNRDFLVLWSLLLYVSVGLSSFMNSSSLYFINKARLLTTKRVIASWFQVVSSNSRFLYLSALVNQSATQYSYSWVHYELH
jgi:hypothetical protein